MTVGHAGWPKADGDRTPPGWRSPGGLAIPKGPAWPQGSARGAAEAEEILAGAIGWWDVGRYASGDRWLRNLGQGGPALDLRLGSSLLPNTNEPKYLAPEDWGYVWIDSTAGNYLSVADEAGLAITGDIDVRVQAAMDWTNTAGFVYLAGQWSSSAGNKAWYLRVFTGGFLSFAWTSDQGTTIRTAYANGTGGALTEFAPWQKVWIKVHVDVDNGTGGWTVQMFTSLDGTTWTQRPDTYSGTPATPISDANTPLTIGALNYNTANSAACRVYRAQVRSGIEGMLVLDADCDALADGSQPTFLASTGQLVVIARSATGRRAVAMPNPLPGRYMEPRWRGTGQWQGGGAWQVLAASSDAALDITGDIDLRAKATFITGTQTFVSKQWGWVRTYSLVQELSSEKLSIEWVDGASTTQTRTSSTTLPARDYSIPLWVRGTLDVDNGAGGHTARFYWSLDGVAWTQLGTDVVTAGTTAIAVNASTRVMVGATTWSGDNTSFAWALTGDLYRVEIRNGIDGTKVFDLDFSGANTGRSFVCASGQTITQFYPAARGIETVRALGGRPVLLFGADDYLEVQGTEQHAMLNFRKGDSATVLTVARAICPAAANYSLLCKKLNGSPNPGWYSILLANGGHLGYVGEETTIQSTGTTQSMSSGLALRGFVIDRPRNVDIAVLNGLNISGQTFQTQLDHRYTGPMRFGTNGAGSSYLSGELVAAVVFRRALSAREIDLIARYYGTVQ